MLRTIPLDKPELAALFQPNLCDDGTHCVRQTHLERKYCNNLKSLLLDDETGCFAVVHLSHGSNKHTALNLPCPASKALLIRIRHGATVCDEPGLLHRREKRVIEDLHKDLSFDDEVEVVHHAESVAEDDKWKQGGSRDTFAHNVVKPSITLDRDEDWQVVEQAEDGLLLVEA